MWFFWPVTFALVTAATVCRLVQGRAWGAAAGAVMSLALPAVPPVLDLRVLVPGAVTGAARGVAGPRH